jgi:enamine deaminase RidA (YjgF/YER057c/UK114 family)
MTRHSSASSYEERYGFCRALSRGPWILVAGTAPIEADGSSVAEGVDDQARRAFRIAIQAIEALGGSASDVVRTRMFLTDAADADSVGRVHAEFFGPAPPVATMVVVAALLDPRWRVEVEVDALRSAP